DAMAWTRRTVKKAIVCSPVVATVGSSLTLDGRDAGSGPRAVFWIDLEPDPVTAMAGRGHAGGAGSGEGIEHHVVRVRVEVNHPLCQFHREGRRMTDPLCRFRRDVPYRDRGRHEL